MGVSPRLGRGIIQQTIVIRQIGPNHYIILKYFNICPVSRTGISEICNGAKDNRSDLSRAEHVKMSPGGNYDGCRFSYARYWIYQRCGPRLFLRDCL